MDLLSLSIAHLLVGFFFAGAIFLTIAICYSALYYMREDRIKENTSDTSWNQEHIFFDTVTEFRDDFSS